MMIGSRISFVSKHLLNEGILIILGQCGFHIYYHSSIRYHFCVDKKITSLQYSISVNRDLLYSLDYPESLQVAWTILDPVGGDH